MLSKAHTVKNQTAIFETYARNESGERKAKVIAFGQVEKSSNRIQANAL